MFIFLSTPSFAQRWTTYSTPQGLAGRTVNHIFVDRQGELWFGVDVAIESGGVSRFNGAWKNYSRDENGLIDNRVTSIVQDKDGMIWLGTFDGVSRIDPNADLANPANWHNYTVANTDSGLSGHRVRAIVIDNDGKIWFGTKEATISIADPTPDPANPTKDPLYNRKNWVVLTQKDGLSGNEVFDMEKDAFGNIWVATSDTIRVYKFDAHRWLKFILSPDDANQRVRAIYSDNDKNVWIGTQGSGVYRVPPNNFSTYDGPFTTETTKGGLADNNIVAITQDQDGAVWFGHETQGVSMAAPDSDLTDRTNWKKFTVSDGLAGNALKAILEDTEENIWFGHRETGVSQLDKTWLSLLASIGARTNFINGLFPDKTGFLWAATEGGAIRLNLQANPLLDKTQKDLLTVANSPLSDNRVSIVFQDSRSYLWFGTGGGTNRVAHDSLNLANKWRTFNKKSGFNFTQARGITEDRRGYIWLAVDDTGVRRVHVDSTGFPNSWLTIRKSNGLTSDNVFAIHSDRRGNLWFATDNGISVIAAAANPKEPANWEDYNTPDGLAHKIVEFIYEDIQGNLWFATHAGVNKVNPAADLHEPANWIKYTEENGLVSDFVKSIAQLDENEFWFGTDVGASKFETDKNRWTSYNSDDGLKNNFIVALFADRSRNQIWFGTNGGGMTRYKPKRRPPETFLSTHYDLVTANRLTFNFRGKDIITPESDLRFQYKLDDEDWQETADRSAAVLVKDTDRPQRHVFQVRTIDRDGNTDPTPEADVFYKIDAVLGGAIELTDGDNMVRLQIPPGEFLGNKSMTITPVRVPDILVIAAYHIFSPQSFKLSKPATLTISFANANGFKRDQLAIFRKNNSAWVPIGGTVTATDKIMTIATVITELDTFAVRNESVLQTSAATPINIQPRVFSPTGGGQGYGERASISFTLQETAAVTVKVYDLSGRLRKIIQENISLLPGANAVYWDGRDDGGRLCASGLYVVLVEIRGTVQTKTVMVANKYE